MIESTWRYRGWVQVVMAALAMVATLPGRTFGLGLITEPLIGELHLARDQFADVNFWATLVGALFCLPAGQLLDRWGSRTVLTAIYLTLGITVYLLAGVSAFLPLLILVTLTRGLGQSALSVVSISMIGRWFDRRLTLATACYSALVSIGFFAAVVGVSMTISQAGWRQAWSGLGLSLIALAPVAWIAVRHQPEHAPHGANRGSSGTSTSGLTLGEALTTPAFWVFAGLTSLYGLIVAGFSLFNQAILAERGFDVNTYYMTAMAGPFIGLLGQALCAYLAKRWTYQRIAALALLCYAAALLGLTQVTLLWQLFVCVLLLGIAGGIIMVLFFAIWPKAFGRRELGSIQGAAQMATVVASAIGPKVFTLCELRFGSLTSTLFGFIPLVLLMAMAALRTPLPMETLDAQSAEATQPA